MFSGSPCSSVLPGPGFNRPILVRHTDRFHHSPNQSVLDHEVRDPPLE